MTYEEAIAAAKAGNMVLRAAWKDSLFGAMGFVCPKRKQYPSASAEELLWIRTDNGGRWWIDPWFPKPEESQATDWELATEKDEDHWEAALSHTEK